MAKIIYYKMTADNGGAPCVERDLLSLAICKPQIRKSALPGDLVFGFAAKTLDPDNRLIYVAKITDKLVGGTYFRSEKYAERADCVYRWVNDRFEWKAGAKHHGSADVEHDLGKPPAYDKANVLLSTDFRYFGSSGTAKYKKEYPHVRQAVENLGRGHRVNHNEQLAQQLMELRDHIWAHTPQRAVSRPTQRSLRGACHRSRSHGVVEFDDC